MLQQYWGSHISNIVTDSASNTCYVSDALNIATKYETSIWLVFNSEYLDHM